MKHISSEMLYFLKIYNYITEDIGIENAIKREKDIRAFIASCDFLKGFETLSEDFSEGKSIAHIITYIQRMETTYRLMAQWKDMETCAILRAFGLKNILSGMVADGLSLFKESENAYFLDGSCDGIYDEKIILIGCNIEKDIIVEEKLLWYELYRQGDSLYLELFTEGFLEYKLCFSAIATEKLFYNALDIESPARSPFENLALMGEIIYKKHKYDQSLLTDKEKDILKTAEYLAFLGNWNLRGASESALRAFRALLTSHSYTKAISLLEKILNEGSERKSERLCKKLIKTLEKPEGQAIYDELYHMICLSQEGISHRIER